MTTTHTLNALCFMSGIGLGTRGLHEARVQLGDHEARFGVPLGIDIDERACRVFERITGGHALVADFHELTSADLRAFTHIHFGGKAPFLVLGSPPCKAFSQLLSKKQAATPEYQRMAQLYYTGLRLAVTTWPDGPAVIQWENVRGVTSRGEDIRDASKALLHEYNYEVDERVFDCAEVGGTPARRPRHILIARRRDLCRQMVALPPRRAPKSCGSALRDLPLPNDPAAGPLHRLPEISLITWLRLAFVRAGSDHRSIPQAVELWSKGLLRAPVAPGQADDKLQPLLAERFKGGFGVRGMNDVGATVTAESMPTNGACSIADDRLPMPPGTFAHCLAVTDPNEPAQTITASPSPSSGRPALADERVQGLLLQHNARRGAFGVNHPAAPAQTVTAHARASGGSTTPAAIAVPHPATEQLLLGDTAANAHRYKGSPGLMGVLDPAEPAATVTAGMSVTSSNAPAAIADERAVALLRDKSAAENKWREGSPGLMGVNDWNNTAKTVSAKAGVTQSNAPAAVSDPRAQRVLLGCEAHNGAYGVQHPGRPGATVTGSGDIHNGTHGLAVEMPRPPVPDCYVFISVDEALDMLARGQKMPAGKVPVIPSPWDGWWHRPMTDRELARLQTAPDTMADGTPFNLGDASRAEARLWIGNAIPSLAARAWGESILMAGLRERLGLFALVDALWVSPLLDDTYEVGGHA